MQIQNSFYFLNSNFLFLKNFIFLIFLQFSIFSIFQHFFNIFLSISQIKTTTNPRRLCRLQFAWLKCALQHHPPHSPPLILVQKLVRETAWPPIRLSWRLIFLQQCVVPFLFFPQFPLPLLYL